MLIFEHTYCLVFMSKNVDLERKVPVTTHLFQRQIDQLNNVAKELQVTKAVLFREAIEQLLKRYEEKQLNIGLK